jgi:starch synthase
VKILFVSAEVAPYAKVGGLADIAASLPKALQAKGHDVRVVVPAYGMIEHGPEHDVPLERDTFWFRLHGDHWRGAFLKRIEGAPVPTYIIGPDYGFERVFTNGEIYSYADWRSYAYFCRAALESVHGLGWMPDVVHSQDWHTGLVPVLMREGPDPSFRNVASVFTIHNLAYQGQTGTEVLDYLELPRSLNNYHQLEHDGSLNILKGGCVFSDLVNTVSPTYSDEIQREDKGRGLDGLMKHLAEQGRLKGILNGIDTDVWNPSTDPNLPVNYDRRKLSGKAECKAHLQRELNLPENPRIPLIGMVSRLNAQKGIDLVINSIPYLAHMPVQLVVLGSGDPQYMEAFRRAQSAFPLSFRYVEQFNDPLAHRIYAGSDLFLMPSKFEPCGLGQMIAMRYGSVPVVEHTGGLVDTVFEGVNGFDFWTHSPGDMLTAVNRAREAMSNKKEWNKIVRSAMGSEVGWGARTNQYEDLYQEAIDRRSR